MVKTGHQFLHVFSVQNKANFYFIIDFNSIIQYKDELPYFSRCVTFSAVLSRIYSTLIIDKDQF